MLLWYHGLFKTRHVAELISFLAAWIENGDQGGGGGGGGAGRGPWPGGSGSCGKKTGSVWQRYTSYCYVYNGTYAICHYLVNALQ